ncbi:succinate dehydrogenase/fumarate reductase iron-sulfur subunit [Candidatus Woesearchaeota archaeon]|nr:MAG: succinate dehydrogenase/fumarate reductase iron-sulfur subunit [Candidatus Woesearchaeota archaeon]
MEVIISRFNGKKRYTSKFNLALKPDLTVSEVLMLIKNSHDGSLSFRAGCRNGVCGICAVKVNNKSVLGCKTKVKDIVVDDKILIEPLDMFPVIKDLVVDIDNFIENNIDIRSAIVSSSTHKTSQEDMRHLDTVSNCIQCGICFSSCDVLNVNQSFIGPAALLRAYRCVTDKRDGLKNQRLKHYNKENYAWDCTHCENCTTLCPQGINVSEHISSLRKELIEQGLKSKGSSHHLAFLKSINKHGLLNEASYPFFSINFNPLRLKEVLPVGLRMLRKRKSPGIFHKPIKNIEEVRKLFREVKE